MREHGAFFMSESGDSSAIGRLKFQKEIEAHPPKAVPFLGALPPKRRGKRRKIRTSIPQKAKGPQGSERSAPPQRDAASPPREDAQRAGEEGQACLKKRKKPHQAERLHLCRPRPIFPARRQASIVGTAELNYRVRNGNGWTLCVKETYYVLATAYLPGPSPGEYCRHLRA